MEKNIKNNSLGDTVEVIFEKDEELKVRKKSIISKSSNLDSKTITGGGKKGLLNAITSRTQFPIIKFKSNDKGYVNLSPPLISKIKNITVSEDEELTIQTLNFIACDSDMNIDVKINSELYDNDALGEMKITGEGEIFISGMGGIQEIELGEEEYTQIHAEYIIGFYNTITYKQVPSSEFKKGFLGAEQSPLFKLYGPGKIYIQNQSPYRFIEVVEKLQ